MTLLKWKLLATPQLGGASSYFSNIAHPGIHVKSWRGSPKNEKVVTNDNSNITSNNSSRTIGEEELGTSVDYTPSSSPSTTAVGTGYLPTVTSSGNHSDHSRVTGIYSRVKTSANTTNTATGSSSVTNVTGMNDIGLLLDSNNNNNNNNNMSNNTLANSGDTVPHPTTVRSTITGRLNPMLKMGWLPGMKQPIATTGIGLASLIDDKVD